MYFFFFVITSGKQMNNNYARRFNRIDFVVIPSYIYNFLVATVFTEFDVYHKMCPYNVFPTKNLCIFIFHILSINRSSAAVILAIS